MSFWNLFAHGVEYSGFEGEAIVISFARFVVDVFFYSDTIERSGKLFFQFEVWENKKISNEIYSVQKDPKIWETILDMEKKMSTKIQAIPLISYGDMSFLIVWW